MIYDYITNTLINSTSYHIPPDPPWNATNPMPPWWNATNPIPAWWNESETEPPWGNISDTIPHWYNFTEIRLDSPSVFFDDKQIDGTKMRCSLNPTNMTSEAYPIVKGIRTTELILSLLLNVTLFVSILSRTKLRKKHSVKLFTNLQLVHILLSALLLLRTFRHDDGSGDVTDYSDDVTLHVINGFLVQMFLSMVACTLDRVLAIRYPYLYERLTTKKVGVCILFNPTQTGESRNDLRPYKSS